MAVGRDRIKMLKVKSLGRKHVDLVPEVSDAEYEALLKDVKKNGIKLPIVVNDQQEIIEGFTRVRVAKDLKMKRVPAIMRTYASELDEKLEAIRLNTTRRQMTPEVRDQMVETARKLVLETLGGKERGPEPGRPKKGSSDQIPTKRQVDEETGKVLGTSGTTVRSQLQRMKKRRRGTKDGRRSRSTPTQGYLRRALDALKLLKAFTPLKKVQVTTLSEAMRDRVRKEAKEYAEMLRGLPNSVRKYS